MFSVIKLLIFLTLLMTYSIYLITNALRNPVFNIVSVVHTHLHGGGASQLCPINSMSKIIVNNNCEHL